jgi:hypothetical protein
MALLINTTLQGGASSGVGFALDTQAVARDLKFFIIGSPGITAGAVTIEEAPSTAGPWAALGAPIAVVAGAVVTANRSGAIDAVRANITTPIVGGTVTVIVMGVSEHDDLFAELSFHISGIEYFPMRGSVDFTDDINARNTLTCNIWDPTGVMSFECGQEIVMLDFDGVTRRFAGTIDDTEAYRPRMPDHIPGMVHRIVAVDYNQLTDRHLVAEAYDDTSFIDIVTDIVSEYLSSDGVVMGNIDAGPTFTRKIFNYRPASECLVELSEDTGFAWWIDYDKRFHFRARESVVAPFVASNGTVRDCRVRKNRGQYRNRQYIRAGRDLTLPQTESFTGDGERQTFNVSYPIGTVPTVSVNGVPKTVGIRGLPEGETSDWTWNKNYTEISQRSDLPPLTDADTLAVVYRGMYPILVQAQADDEIANRQAVEGGSGLYEAIEDYGDVDSADLAFDTALAKLHRDGYIRRSITLDTDQTGLASGQVLEVVLPKYDLNGLFLVQSVSAVEGGRNTLMYTATLLDGDAVGGWLTFYQRLMAARRENVVRDNEVLLLLRNVRDRLALTDDVDITSAAPVSTIGPARIGYAQIAA